MIKITTLFLALSMCSPSIVFSQEYAAEYSTRNYEPLVNATLLDESNPTTDPSGGERYEAIPIGFDFTYYNNTYNSLKVGQNGYVIFEQNGIFRSFINIFECKQMNFQNNPSLSPIYYEVSGAPGNRIFKLEFVKSGFVNDSQQDDYINYQLWIYEYCNVFEFHFGNIAIDPAELDLFFNNASAPFMGYGKNNPYLSYLLDGSTTAPTLSTNPLSSLDSVPDSSSVYTFRNCFVSIGHEEVNPFSIYPNPTTDIVNFRFSDVIEASELSIINLSGQTVFTDIVSPASTYSLSTDFLTQGVYIVRIKSAKKSYSTKLVIP